MLKANSAAPENTVYASHCDVMHMDRTTRKDAFDNLAPNSIISSYFSAFEAELHLSGALGVKYVSEGKETYWVKGKKNEITAGKYLLVNESEPRLDVKIKGEGALGMCVNIDADLLNDVIFQVLCPNNLDDMKNVERYFLSPELLIRENQASNGLQQFLNELIWYVENPAHTGPSIELVFELASIVVRENLDLISSYYKLQATKAITRQELFQRLLRGKEILSDSIFTEISIAEVADMCCLSEFRFYRLFRQCFGISPYNFLFKRRIEKGLELKKQNLGWSWSEIAYQLNFTDLAAFSKGFKKSYGSFAEQVCVSIKTLYFSG